MFFFFLIAQATTGKQGVLGPTKLYVAVHPPATPSTPAQTSGLTPTTTTPVVNSKTEPETENEQNSPTLSPGKIYYFYYYFICLTSDYCLFIYLTINYYFF